MHFIYKIIEHVPCDLRPHSLATQHIYIMLRVRARSDACRLAVRAFSHFVRFHTRRCKDDALASQRRNVVANRRRMNKNTRTHGVCITHSWCIRSAHSLALTHIFVNQHNISIKLNLLIKITPVHLVRGELIFDTLTQGTLACIATVGQHRDTRSQAGAFVCANVQKVCTHEGARTRR